MSLDLTTVTPLRTDPYPFNADQEAWLRELETTDRKQGHSLLRSGNDEYCCLGVAMEMFGPPPKHLKADFGRSACYAYGDGGDVSSLNQDVRKRLRLCEDLAYFRNPLIWYGKHWSGLATLNDTRDKEGKHVYSFKDIAAYCRHDPWNVFLPPEGTESAVAA